MNQQTCAIVAGSGTFPRQVAQEAKRRGLKVVAFGLRGWADPSLADAVDVYEEVAVGQLGHLIARLKTHHAAQVVMAGKVTKGVLFDASVQFDGETLQLLRQAKDTSVQALLGAVGARLAQDGMLLLDSSVFLKESLCAAGVLTRRAPTAEEQRDVQVGLRVARALAHLDIGQTAVVKRQVVVAVEALEGTDATIRRAGQLAGDGLVVVKMASPAQDMRFDLPILGPQTIDVCVASGVRCIAVEAHKTLFLDRAALLEKADTAGLACVGIESAQMGTTATE